MSTMKGFWIRFFADDAAPICSRKVYDEHLDDRFFCSGYRGEKQTCVMLALVHISSLTRAKSLIKRYFPEARFDSAQDAELDWRPGDRFLGMKPLLDHEVEK